MFPFKVLLVITFCFSWSYGDNSDYCKLCKDHTMCQYSGLGKACKDPGGGGVSDEEKKEIVNLHNSLRRSVARGEEKRGVSGPQPKAADIMKIEWDNELSKVAQMWADQCLFQHDTCRNDPRWAVGQNLYWNWKSPVNKVNWTATITSWYNEVEKFDPKGLDSYIFQSGSGHYTQIVWHNSYKIGCGRRDYGLAKLYVCNYGAAGNFLTQPVYIKGEPCSKCPENTSCEDSLCVHKSISPRKKQKNVNINNTNICNSASKTQCEWDPQFKKLISTLRSLLAYVDSKGSQNQVQSKTSK